MVSIDPSAQGERDNYNLLIGSIVPRPIAFVTTLSPDGVLNAAPFSYFSIVSSNPPLLSVSVQRKAGQMKDTARYAKEKRELVIHVVDEHNVEAVNQTAASLPPHESEVTLVGLTPVDSDIISVPGVAEAKIRMECVLEHDYELGGTADAPSSDLLIARIVRLHIADEIIDMNSGRIDAQKLAPVSRLAGTFYAKLGDMFDLDRP